MVFTWPVTGCAEPALRAAALVWMLRTPLRMSPGNNATSVIIQIGCTRSYADNHNNDQRYWDGWFRMLQPSTSKVPWSVSFGKCGPPP